MIQLVQRGLSGQFLVTGLSVVVTAVVVGEVLVMLGRKAHHKLGG